MPSRRDYSRERSFLSSAAQFPVFAILGVATGARLTLLPYAYLADPLPVYRQSQDTRAGLHAYSYAGGPSAKEEVRGLDGVTRGSYSYLDARGVLQSVFYVADRDGFRVAATNLPTDGEADAGRILLAGHTSSYPVEQEEKKKNAEVVVESASRRKRSGDQDRPSQPAEKPSRSRSSHEHSPIPTKKQADEDRRVYVAAPAYRLLAPSVLIPRLADVVATSSNRNREVDTNGYVAAATTLPPRSVEETIGILPGGAYETAILAGHRVPLAISHQSRLQVHDAEAPARVLDVVRPTYQLLLEAPLVAAPADYNGNRIQLHRDLGLEGGPIAGRKDAVKIDALPLAVAVVEKSAPPIAASVPGRSGTPIYRDVAAAVPIAGPAPYLATAAAAYVRPIAHWPILAPVARSSQHRVQIHTNGRIEPAE